MIKTISSIFLISLFFLNPVFSAEKIVFIDIDKVIYQSNLGKKLNKENNANIKKEEKKFNDLEKNLKKKEDEIVKQQNILSKEELNKKVNNLRDEINEFKKKRRSTNEKFAQLRLKQTNSMVISLNTILSDFADKNSISLIVQKKNIVIGKSELDITNQILEIFNKQVKSLKK